MPKKIISTLLLILTFATQNAHAQGDVACRQQYNEAIQATRTDWENNLQNLIDQEKPASEMVDDAYENLRTYNCWLEYICRSVQYSGYGVLENNQAGLTHDQLGQVPGCQYPEDLVMGEEYLSFAEKIRIGDYEISQIEYFPACQTDKDNNNANVSITTINDNFNSCKQSIEREFGCDPTQDDFDACMSGITQSTAVAVMESALKASHADQKASALENKLASIVTKMHAMEEHLNTLYNFLIQLNQRYSCIAQKCT